LGLQPVVGFLGQPGGGRLTVGRGHWRSPRLAHQTNRESNFQPTSGPPAGDRLDRGRPGACGRPGQPLPGSTSWSAGTQRSTSTARAAPAVASRWVAVTRDWPASARTFTCSRAISSPESARARTRQLAASPGGNCTVNSTVTPVSVRSVMRVTVGLYVGSPYRWYRRSDTASPATTVAMISTAGSHRGKRRGFRRRPYRPGGNIGDGWSVVACVSVTAVFSVGCIGKNGRVPGYE